MPDVMQQVNELKSLPDQSLQFELANPSGAVPAYLVLAEAQRRQLLRSAAQSQQNQAPIGSVYDDVIRSMMARQPQPGQAPAGMTPPPASPPSMPQNAQSPLAMAEGGEVDENGDEEDDSGDGGFEDSPEISTTGSASRSSRGRYDDLIDEIAQRHGRDPNEIRAIMQAESSGDPNVVSPKGAIGLMQLMPATGHKYGAKDLTNPRQNIEAGVSFLDHLYDRYDDPDVVHAAYNAGEGAVDKAGGIPHFRETEKYVGKVNQLMAQNAAQGSADRAVESEVPDPQTDRPYPILGTGPVVGPPAGGIAAAAGQASPSTPAVNNGSTGPSADVSDLPMTSQRGFVLPPTVTPPPQSDPWSQQSLTDTYNTFNQMRNLPVQQNPREIAMQKMLDQFYAEAQARKKPGVWDYITNFGLGMASTPSRNWAQSIAGGATGMVKGIQAQQEDARKEQLQAMGVDLSLDDKMRAQQQDLINKSEDVAKTQQQAITAAERNDAAAQKTSLADQVKAFEDLRKVHGAVYGPGSMFDPKTTDFTFTPDPRNATFGVWSPPSMRKVPKELLPILNGMGGNPMTGKPFAVNDLAPYDLLEKARTQTGQVVTQQQKHVTTQAELNAAAGIQQTLAGHPELPQIMNPDGTPMDPAAIRVNNLPQALQNEALWRIRIIRDGWTPKNVEGALADKDAPADLKATAKLIQANQATQAGAVTGARANATLDAKQARQAKEGAVLTQKGSNIMGDTDNVGSSIDQLLDLLNQPKYRNDKNPLSIAGAWARYRMGIGAAEDDELGQALSKLSLTSVQAAMPYASKSRAMKWIDMVMQHLPNPPFDSPSDMLNRLKTARRGILGIERSALQWEIKNAPTNAPAPALTPDRVQQYLRLADGDRKKAIQMAKEDGWGPPSMGQ